MGVLFGDMKVEVVAPLARSITLIATSILENTVSTDLKVMSLILGFLICASHPTSSLLVLWLAACAF